MMHENMGYFEDFLTTSKPMRNENHMLNRFQRCAHTFGLADNPIRLHSRQQTIIFMEACCCSLLSGLSETYEYSIIDFSYVSDRVYICQTTSAISVMEAIKRKLQVTLGNP